MKIILLTAMMALCICGAYAQQSGEVKISGKVSTSIDGQELPGALVKEADSKRATVTNAEGYFELETEHSFPKKLTVSFIGFFDYELELNSSSSLQNIEVQLIPDEIGLGEVEILSTGFEEIPKERATGSFVQVDRELINRRVSTNLLERLEDVTSGLVFNRAGPASDRISIRGRSTIFAETQPLIIVDNFPYDGPLENINPNDIESITVLRDAAAASIWGARSGNGVIVVTTKRGTSNQPMQISLNANTNFIQAPDLLARPWMDMGDFVDLEQELFGRGIFNAAINNLSSRQALSPGIETMVAHRNGLISDSEKDSRLDHFRMSDSRRELLERYYRSAVNSQYSLGFTGGTDVYRYSFSVGHDSNLASEIGNSNNRTTVSSNNNWSLINRKLDLGISFNYAENNSDVDTQIPNLYPYERLADENGMPLQVIREHNLRYVNSFTGTDWQDWRYFPLQEIGILDNSTRQKDARFNLSAGYSLTSWLKRLC